MSKGARKGAGANISDNRKARHDYEIVETFEAGIVLKGTEVKSLRMGNSHISEAHAVFKGNELFLLNAHIATYDFGNINNHVPDRTRKLLLHKKELTRLFSRVKEAGLTIVPLKMYFDEHNRAKVLIALARGKKTVDKRESVKERDTKRDMARFRKGMNL